MLEQYRHAVGDLTWRYHRADALIGMRGQAIEGGGSGGFDGAAASRLHDAMIRASHREAIVKIERIDGQLARLPLHLRHLLAMAFEPFGRASPTLAASFMVEGIPLVRVVLESGSAVPAFRRAKKLVADRDFPPVWTVLEWMEDEVRGLAHAEHEIARLRTRKPVTGHAFEAIRRRAFDSVRVSIAMFDQVRTEEYRRRGETVIDRHVQLLYGATG